MLDYSTWGDAWGFSWGDAWGCVDADTPRSRGGYPWENTSGKAKRYLREQVPGEVYDNVRLALAAVEAAERAPTKRKVRRATKAVEVIQGFDLDMLPESVSGRIEAIPDTITDDTLARALAHLEYVTTALAQIERRKKQRNDTVLALLLSY